MSEYQFYEFRAVDRMLSPAEMANLRRISTRARITGAGFMNSYDWGDLKADPRKLVDRYFDLFVYFADWGSRHFAMRVPKSALAHADVDRFLPGDDCARIRRSGANVVIEVTGDEIEADDLDDGKGWLDTLAPLRADVLDGDFRFLYLIWLLGVATGVVPNEEPEPLPGLAPVKPAHEAFAEFLGLDPDLVAVAARSNGELPDAPSRMAVADTIQHTDTAQKDAWLLRLYEGDSAVRAEVRRYCRGGLRRHLLPHRGRQACAPRRACKSGR